MGTPLLSPVSRGTADTGPRAFDSRLAALALLLAIVGAVALLIPHGPVRLVLLLAFMTAAPGAAIVSYLRIADRILAVGLAITFSLGLTALVAALMVWAEQWHPSAATAATLVVTAGLALGRLRPVGGPSAADTTAPPPIGSGALAPTLLTVGAALWLVTVLRADPDQIGPYGLTWGLGVPFVAAVAMTCLGCGVELFGRERLPVLIAGVGVLACQMWGSAPLMLPVPEYSWTYKHVGVVEFIQQHGAVLDADDIYQQWPAFFAAVAQLSTVAGVPSIRFAAWSSLYFGLLDVVLIAAVVSTLSRSTRVLFGTVLGFTACLWVDQNYFSPQAFAYALSLGFFALLMHGCRGLPASRAAGRLNRLRLLLVRDAPTVRDRPRWPLLLAVVLLFAAITVAHQLTPYLLLFGVGVLTVLGLIRPYWLIGVLAVVAGGYFLPRMGGVSSQYHLFDGFNLFSNASGNSSGWGSTPQKFSAVVARALAFLVWLTALVVGWRRRRSLGLVVIPLVLGFTPFLLLLLQNYGGEAIYRVFLFSLPWCALLAASWWVLLRAGVWRGLTSGVILTVLALAGLQGLQGQFMLHAVPPADVRAAQYLEEQAPAGSTMTLVAAAFPARLTAGYGSINPGRSVDPSIVDEPSFRRLTLDADQLPAIETWAASYGGTETFLVVTDQMRKNTEYFGYLPDGSVDALRKALDASPRWSTYYRRADITIYRLEPAP
ncbi:hypothetical protein [Cryptosporangium aurantiacum]|uniref:Uncharacterized protein n=1 Tax=Cryptosporangium aurantiacum TaxID=134849 RepID=A0A1M7RN00_9ACTN|nr:hypothetical protein [Cryptosporangium aurantiacum]SHN47570.1 hypothetical protein SAMN05443668_12530 [Cryptosporangium aurantiacum]